MADLLARAREQGAVALADIAVALDASDLPAHAIDGVARMLSDEGVDILDAAPEEPESRPEAGPADEARRPVTSDLVRIYLREIGRVPLLRPRTKSSSRRRSRPGCSPTRSWPEGCPAAAPGRLSSPCSPPRGCARNSG